MNINKSNLWNIIKKNEKLAQKFIEGDNIKIDVKDDEIVFDK